MTFEYEIRLKDGRLVNVVGEADLSFPLGPDEHPVDSVEIESAVEVVNGDEAWLDLALDSRLSAELEDKVADKLFAELQEGVCEM